MNWDALGAFAETISAIAVVVTFVFLTIQLRQNTRAIEHATNRAVFEDAYTWMYKVAESPEMADLYLAGMNGEALSSRDRLRFSLLLNTLFVHWNHAFDAGAFEIVNNSQIAGVLARPGGAAYWERVLANRSISLSPGFIAHVEALKPERTA
jgi:hypothetical protein